MCELTEWQYKLIEPYIANEMQRLKKITNRLISTYGGVSNFMYDDFYSIANEQLWRAVITYDEKKNDNFEAYLKVFLKRKFKTYLRDMHVDKRCIKHTVVLQNGKTEIVYENDVRLDEPLSEETEICLADVLVDSRYEYVLNDDEELKGQLKLYIGSLTKLQKKILYLKYHGYNSLRIKEKLNISGNKYNELLQDMTSFIKTLGLQRTLRM